MKLKKRIDNCLNGFHVAAIPRAPRSIRRRAQLKKTEEDGQICAFELLASLARKLLQESESSSSSNASGNDIAATGKDAVQDRHRREDKPLKKECLDQGSCEESAIVSQSVSQNCDQKCSLNEFPLAEDDDILERSSKIIDSVCLGKIGDDTMYKSNTATGSFPCKVEGGFNNFGDSGYNAVENFLEKRSETKSLETGGLNSVKMCNSRDPTELCMSFPALINSDRDVKLPSYRSHIPNASFSRHRNAIKLGCRDDDDNLSRSNKLSNKLKVYRPVTRIGDRRIRKLLTSKYWKVAPKLKDFELSRADVGTKPLHRKRKTCCNYERYQHDALWKRRKFYDQNSAETFDGGFSSESVTNSPEKGRNVEKRGLASMLQGASGMTSSVAGHQASLQSKDSNVRFSIKSFKIPEIFIEVSETATVASLKRTVMDAVTAILGGGLRVGIVLHGKKIRDDKRTLSQTGISSEDSLDSLGFTLEPSPVQAPPPVCSEDPPLLLPCDTPSLLTRSPVTPALDSAIPNAIPDPPINEENHVESNHDPTIPHTDTLTDTTLPDSRALVAVPAMNVQALAVVPVSQKSRRSDIVQRRTRRPFSVSEVEALVQAVEELGTGRWRDVKLRSFEDADHRTYVDLKVSVFCDSSRDVYFGSVHRINGKTLVHTARISPQQRRGEPVPQELLDRVLAAHAYWSQHQAKQQGKHQPGILKLEAQADSDRVTGN